MLVLRLCRGLHLWPSAGPGRSPSAGPLPCLPGRAGPGRWPYAGPGRRDPRLPFGPLPRPGRRWPSRRNGDRLAFR
ncbi:hypothetical protein D7044_07435 [Micromonospora musae]|uniref:Uncharacterized protein n=1 Tax=Micromonospora musae TaxID=1894970 RepID=A0A3A9YKX8_9ACTN|nr:hypothetical protein D7044_07435 [Micromonospora musae]